MAESYRIAGWEEYQHYKHRNPPWVRLYYDLLSSETWVAEDDATRCLMVACILAASRHGGEVPANPKYLMKVAHLNSPPNFKPLIDNGFLVASIVPADCGQGASGVQAALYSVNGESIEEQRTENRAASKTLAGEPAGFPEFWSAYPSNKDKKAEAHKSWLKLKPNAELQAKILAALDWQRKQPKWVKDNGDFVPMAVTYLNQRRWEDEPPAGTPGAPPKPKPPRMETDMDRALARMAREMVDE